MTATQMGLLARLLNAAEERGRLTLVRQALAYQAQGDIPAAHASLGRALALAEPEGYVRIFVDEGPPMAQLLSAAAARGIMPHYTGRLLAAFDAEAQKTAEPSTMPAARPTGP